VLPGDSRLPARWQEGARGYLRRLPGVYRELGRVVEGPQKAWDEGAGAGGRSGALGFWAAIRDVFPETRSQRDWVHKSRNVLDSMPKSVHSRAKAAIKEITCAENKKGAIKAIEAFAEEFGAKWPKAIEKITEDEEALLTFYDYPAEHWRHLRTTNPVESVFAPVKARTEITKGPGSRQAGLAMIYKLIEAAEGRWRKLTGSHLVALVRAGAKFRNGELVEGSEE
jgi:putative transposase